MTSNLPAGFSSLKDPCFSAAEYLRFADHRSPDVRLWALDRLEELGLDLPEETFRRLLKDGDQTVAVTAAELAGRRKLSALADALLARLEAAEDVVGAACAQSLAELGDRRVVAAIARRSHLAPEERGPAIWLALSTMKGPEAAGLLREAFGRLPRPAAAPAASALCEALMLADPEGGVPLVVERWSGQDDEDEADALLDSLLVLGAFEGGAEELREAMEPDQEDPELWMPGDILDHLAEGLPLGPIRQARRACRKRRWNDALEPLACLADALADRAPASPGITPPLTLVRALRERAGRLPGDGDKTRDAVGLMLLALDEMVQEEREAGLQLPEPLEEQLRWLLSDGAFIYPEGQARVLARVAGAGAMAGWEKWCIQTIERRGLQARVAARLVGDWRCEAAIPALVGALGDPEEEGLCDAALEALALMGDPALDAVLERLRSAEDPVLLQECLAVCIGLPSRRVVEAICRRFEDLFIVVPESLLNAIGKIGAREFREPLGRELREGEVQAEETFAFLCALHGADDPRLPAIRKRQTERSRRMAEMADHPADVRQDHLDMALKCNGCRRTYTYAVRAITVDPETPEGEDLQPFIRDRIRCKGCGREDDYTLAPMGHLALTAQLAILVGRMEQEGPAAALEGPLYLRRMVVSDGRRMNPREARRDYEERIARRADDPGLHIGYGNVLRVLGELGPAEAAYRRALELDPRAIEAAVGLGQAAEEREDLAAAKEAYRAGLALGRGARFYHVRDRRQLMEGLERALENVQGRLAFRPPDPVPAQRALEALAEQSRGEPKVGRNAPCPCGSGKKYKKCCLPKESAPAVGGGRDEPDMRLRDRLVTYVSRSLPEAEFQRALREFHGEELELAAQGPDLDTDEGVAEWAEFLEWCIHDFHLSTGRTPIAQFLADRGHSLPPDERAILEEWQDVAVGLHEVVDLEPGKSLTLRDVFTGETHRVREVRGSLSAARWDLVGGRLIRVRGEPQLAGVMTPFYASHKEGLVRHVHQRYEAHRRQRPEASWRGFFRAEPLIFRRYSRTLIRDYRPPEPYTAEGHPIMLGRVRYDVRDVRRLVAALSAAPDFAEDSPPGDPAGTREFTWLRTGPAERWVREAPPPPHGIMIASQRIEDPARAGVPSLATLTLAGDRLTVEAVSAERLAWAKGRLANLAADAVSLRSDVVQEPWRKARGGAPGRQPEGRPPAVPPEVEAQIVGQALRRHYTAWLDQAAPALGGQTPRTAARDPRQRSKLIQLLREMENHQGRARQQGKAWYDVGWIWEALGIGRQEA